MAAASARLAGVSPAVASLIDTGMIAMDRIDPPSRDTVAAFEAATSTDDKLAVLRAEYRVEPVLPGHRFEDDATYLIVGTSATYLIRTQTPAIEGDQLRFISCTHDGAMKPLDLSRLRAAVDRQRVYALQPKAFDPAERDRIIDVGAFSQLVDAAQRSGLVPGIATIIQVRDCEFRLGRHLQALQLMETQFQGFVGRASQRAQRLAREEADIASGRLRMSPKELQAKRLRDSQQTQHVERARTKFQRVLEGLRTIVQRGM